MDLPSHKKTLSIIHICYGALYFVVFLLLSGLFSTFFPFLVTAIVEEEGEQAIGILSAVGSVVQILFVVLLIFSALPSIIGGVATLKNRRWGMVLLMIAGCLSLFSFPFGTAIGVYTIYVFIEDNKQHQ